MLTHHWNVFNKVLLPTSCMAEIQGRLLKLVRTVFRGCLHCLTRRAYKILVNILVYRKSWFPQIMTSVFRERTGWKRISIGIFCVKRRCLIFTELTTTSCIRIQLNWEAQQRTSTTAQTHNYSQENHVLHPWKLSENLRHLGQNLRWQLCRIIFLQKGA